MHDAALERMVPATDRFRKSCDERTVTASVTSPAHTEFALSEKIMRANLCAKFGEPAVESARTGKETMRVRFVFCVAMIGMCFLGAAAASEIHEACELGDATKVKALLKANPALANVKDENGGAVPLAIAVGAGKKEIVKALVAAGADIGVKNGTGWMPVHFSAGGKLSGASKDCAEFVVPADAAQIAQWEKEGFTAAHRAVALGQKEALKKILAEQGDAVKNARDSAGWTPLFWAAVNADKAAAEMILAAKPDLEIKNELGQTALQTAVVLGNKDMVDVLLKHNANAKDAVKLARQFAQKDVEELLKKRGVKE